jgi:hypothetical protein
MSVSVLLEAQELKVGATISSNRTGKQGDYYVEYWKDNGSGTMTLKEGCSFSCEWGQVSNILFRKGIRPGSKDQVVIYSADYKPQGNSYLSIYGWFRDPLVEYYIIESWGSWKPPGGASKGSFETDSGTYDIYQNQRTGPSIDGDNKTFQQYWSVRKTKRTNGVITCGNHFDAWEKKGMKIGKFYEVSFNVEAYQSPGGKADVNVSMTTKDKYSTGIRNSIENSSLENRMILVNSNSHQEFYNALGRKITNMPATIHTSGQNFVLLNNSTEFANGVYYLIPERR